MKVCVFGLWHLGAVTAACLAFLGHDVVGLDDDASTVARLNAGEPPLHEPGLTELLRKGLDKGNLRFTNDARDAVKGARVLWVTFDTPVDDDDRADVDFVVSRVQSLFEHLDKGTLIIVSSQLPAGTVLKLEAAARGQFAFASVPENLRLGKAIEVFLRPDRVVVGVRTKEDRAVIEELLAPLQAPIEWMSVESAEMTKHALNAFLATSVAFINEIAVVCEQVGADAQEVARGLKSDARIGPRAYLGPGAAFAGGTLARDIEFLKSRYELPLIAAVKTSNDRHKGWVKRKIESVLTPLRGLTIAIWGLTYKPGTDTLRRSSSVELCKWLLERGVHVNAHDPMVHSLPEELSQIQLFPDAAEAVREADGLVVATEWPDYKTAPIPKGMTVFDANRFISAREGLRYYSVGMPPS